MKAWRTAAVLAAVCAAPVLVACATSIPSAGGPTTAAAPGSVTSAPSTVSAGGPSPARLPDRISRFAKVTPPGSEDVDAAVSTTGNDTVVGFYGADSSSPSYLVVGTASSAPTSQAALDAILRGVSGSTPIDPAKVIDRTVDGVPYRCAPLGSAKGAYCSWGRSGIVAVVVSIPPAGPIGVEDVLAFTVEARTALTP